VNIYPSPGPTALYILKDFTETRNNDNFSSQQNDQNLN